MKKIIILFFVVSGLVAGYFFQANSSSQETSESVTAETGEGKVASEDEASAVVPGDPVLVRIPSINVEVDVERVEKDEAGRMDVPTEIDDAAWYGLGAKPGERGNAVIAAHYDTPSGDPSVFYSLNTLDEGDEIEVEDALGNVFVYEVVDVEEHETNNFPLQEVFGSTSEARLNLITCGGVWNEEAEDYMMRTVVYSELVEGSV